VPRADPILGGDALAGIEEGARDYWAESGPAGAPAGERAPAGHADQPAVAPSKA
jgi:hypothetical protein